jgi:type VI secretion system protein ImpA
MSNIKNDKLLEPVSEESPCGDDLEYDPAFGELERAAQGKEGHEIGDKEIPAEPPVWSDVSEAAEALFERTKDLRVAVPLVHARLNLDGVSGLASGLELINKMLHEFWDDLHPELDAEDDNDPTLRMNTLMPLNGQNEFIGSLDRAVLVSSKTLGRFSMRDIRLANGEISTPEGDDTATPDPTHIEAAFLDCELEELTANSDAVTQCIDTLQDLESYAREQVGTEFAPDLSALSAGLKAVHNILRNQLARRGVELDAVEGEAAGDGVAPASVPGEIRSRDDAIRVLDQVCEYFRKNEPSSPVPLLLQRAKRLISKDFMEILRDLTPQGVSEAEMIGGVDRDD